MKKLALILAFMLIPCAAFGLEMLDDSSMDSITGQAGVSIAMDDVQIFMNIEKLAWIDGDGVNSWEGKAHETMAGGAMVLNNFQLDVLNINAIVGANFMATTNALGLYSTSSGNIPLFYDYATSDVALYDSFLNGTSLNNLGLNNYYDGQGSNSAFSPHFLTIDVTDKLPASSEGLQFWATNPWSSAAVSLGTGGLAQGVLVNSTVGGVLIGIPTMEIYINAMSFTPMYDGDIDGNTSLAANDDDIADVTGAYRSFGTVYMQGITFTTLSGWIEISPK